ncbi:MAG: hypothetical protein LBS99_03040 [Clostridiales bacterium]|jgi:hypothetical protein|nr:hypothetical protein [Clostridiales bacterium]
MYFFLRQQINYREEKFMFFDAYHNTIYRTVSENAFTPLEITMYKGETPVMRIEGKSKPRRTEYNIIDAGTGKTFAYMKSRFSLGGKFDVTTGSGALKMEGTFFSGCVSITDSVGRTLVRAESERVFSDGYKINFDGRSITPELALALLTAFFNAINNNKRVQDSK